MILVLHKFNYFNQILSNLFQFSNVYYFIILI